MNSDKESEVLKTIKYWLKHEKSYPPNYYAFFTKWTLVNLYYNLFISEKEVYRVLELGEELESYWDKELENLARKLVLTECVGEGPGADPPNKHVRDATLYLREVLGINSEDICSECRKNKSCSKKRTGEFKKKMQALLRIIYQIRCNLFHGDKVYTNERNNELVEVANEILDKVLKLLIKD